MIRPRAWLGPAALALTLSLGCQASFAQDATPVATPTTGPRVFALPGEQVFPEGVAFREETGDFFVGSSTDGTIFRGNVASDDVAVLVEGGEGRTALGMKVDDGGRLFVAGGPTGLVSVYDTTNGGLIAQFTNGLAPNTFLNDIALSPDGDAYVTDSFNPILFSVPAAALGSVAATPVGAPVAGGALDFFLDLTGTVFAFGQGFNANGIVATDDAQSLLVVQTNTGILYRVELSSQEVTAVDLGGAVLDGGDGMLLAGRTLYVVRQGQITVVELSADYATGTVGESFADPSFSTPTTIARYNGCLLVVNSQFANQGGTPDVPFTVSGIPIPAAANAGAGTPETATPVASGC